MFMYQFPSCLMLLFFYHSDSIASFLFFPSDFSPDALANCFSLVQPYAISHSNHRHHTRTIHHQRYTFHFIDFPNRLCYSSASLFFPRKTLVSCLVLLISLNLQPRSLSYSSGIWAGFIIVQWIRCVYAYTFIWHFLLLDRILTQPWFFPYTLSFSLSRLETKREVLSCFNLGVKDYAIFYNLLSFSSFFKKIAAPTSVSL